MSDTAQVGAVDSEPHLRRLPLLLLLLVLTAAGFVWGELLLAGPIVFLVSSLGFWRGYVAFCLLWAGLGLFVLSAWLRIEPRIKAHVLPRFFPARERGRNKSSQTPSNWRERLVLRTASFSRALGVLASAAILGPVYGWAVMKLLGYRQRDAYLFTIAAAWIFGGLWVPFYGLGVWGLGLSRVLWKGRRNHQAYTNRRRGIQKSGRS